MTHKEFANWLRMGLYIFTSNSKHLELKDRSREEWMITFLKWLEWETDQHKGYWDEDYYD